MVSSPSDQAIIASYHTPSAPLLREPELIRLFGKQNWRITKIGSSNFVSDICVFIYDLSGVDGGKGSGGKQETVEGKGKQEEYLGHEIMASKRNLLASIPRAGHEPEDGYRNRRVASDTAGNVSYDVALTHSPSTWDPLNRGLLGRRSEGLLFEIG